MLFVCHLSRERERERERERARASECFYFSTIAYSCSQMPFLLWFIFFLYTFSIQSIDGSEKNDRTKAKQRKKSVFNCGSLLSVQWQTSKQHKTSVFQHISCSPESWKGLMRDWLPVIETYYVQFKNQYTVVTGMMRKNAAASNCVTFRAFL